MNTFVVFCIQLWKIAVYNKRITQRPDVNSSWESNYLGMSGIFDKKLKILLAVTVTLLVVTIALYAINHFKPSTEFETTTTTSTSVHLTTPTTTTEPTTTETTTTTTTEEPTTTEETTTEPTSLTTPVPTKHHFSHLVIFLDVQRAVFFHTNANGEAIPEVSLRISTGRVKGSTPVTPPDKPFILSGYKARQLLFTKAETWVWVRYATHVNNDIFIHSQPYDHQVDANGKTLPLDKSLFSKWGYNRLGKNTASNGCIRLSLRDAQYVTQNIHRGMPCYIFQSSKGYDLPEAPTNPPANLNNRWDPTDPDPLNPYVHREQKSMAWQYKPVGQDIEVLLNEQVSPASGVQNSDSLPSGTTYKFTAKIETKAPAVINTKIVITYPDKSAEEVTIKVRVLDPATTTTTVATEPPTTTPEPTTTAAPTTAAPPPETPAPPPTEPSTSAPTPTELPLPTPTESPTTTTSSSEPSSGEEPPPEP